MTSATLLDGNVLVALAVADHVHHEAADSWFAALDGPFATCPITQGTLVRTLIREGQPGDVVQTVVATLAGDSRHELWLDDLSYEDVQLTTVIGHRQVTDTYLAALARAHRGRLASFDQGMAQVHPDVVDLVPTPQS